MSENNNFMGNSTPEASPNPAPTDQSQETLNQSQPNTSETPAPAAETKKIKQLRLKIDGNEEDFELPFELDESHQDWMTKNLQLSKKAQKSMQSESQLRTQVDQFVKSLKSDTKNTLKQMGIDPKQFAADLIEAEMQEMAMTPEQKERHELQTKLKQLEDERKAERTEFDKRETERLTQQEYERIDNKMTAVIDSSGLPKSPYIVKKIAQYMSDGLKFGVDLQPEDVIDLVKSEVHSDIKELIAALGEDKVESFIGKDILDKVRKKNLSKAKMTPATMKAAIKDVGTKKTTTEKPADKVSMRDFFKL